MKNFFWQLVRRIVRGIANRSDIPLYFPWSAQGQHLLKISGNPSEYQERIPKSVYFNTGCGEIVIGENVVFGEHVMLLTGKHMDIEESSKLGLPLHSVPEGSRDIIIEDGCYIGSGAIIIGPCRLGKNVVVAAGAVVGCDVKSYTVVAGVPARPIRNLTNQMLPIGG